MRVFVFANRGHGTTALRTLLQCGAEVIGVCSAPPRRPTLRALLGRLRSDFRDPFADAKHPFQFGVRAFPSSDLDAVRAWCERSRPDLILCCSFHRLVPAAILGTARHAVNIHPGLLPERGGGTPNRWAIREGDAETGVTAHLMTERFDAGDIVYRRSIAIPGGATWGAVEKMLSPLIADAVASVYAAAQEGRFTLRPQTPRLQKSYRGEPFNGQPVPEACRAMLPKACPYGLRQCRRARNRPCGLR